MADDLQNRLQEANKHFNNKAYDTCLHMLNTCPKDDPKVQHNMALVAFHKTGSLRPFQSGGVALSNGAVALEYEGHEIGLLNQAFALQQGGDHSDEAQRIADGLLPFAALIPPKQQARLAILLRGLNPSAIRTKANPTTILPSLDTAAVQSADPNVSKALQLAFSDTTGLHTWYRDSTKSYADKAAYFNALAIDAFAASKLAIAAHHFAKAAEAAEAASTAICPSTVSAIHFNNGLCGLARGKDYLATLGSFVSAQAGMGGSVRLWLRIAETCVHHARKVASEKSLQLDSKRLSAQSSALHDDGVKPAFVPFPSPALVYPQGQTSTDALSVAYNQATQAFHNALALLVDYKAESLASAAARLSNSGFVALAQSLAGLCYVELSKGNYPAAVLHHSEFTTVRALRPKLVSADLVASVACYGAEALCACNKPAQALKHLQSLDFNELMVGTSDDDSPAKDENVEALFINLTIAHIMAGQWAKALSIGQSVLPKFKSKFSTLLQVYLDLAQGNKEKALEVLENSDLRPPF